MGATFKCNRKQWQLGDLVLQEADPKIHAMLMEIIELRRNEARTVYLDSRSRKTASDGVVGKPNDGWHSLEELQDPALFLNTEEFLQTLRERAERGFLRRTC